MKKVNSIHEAKEMNAVEIFIVFILLIAAIFGYILVNKYVAADPAKTEKNIIKKTGDDVLSEKDALKLGTEKYYLAMATITNTSSDIDKLYNALKTKNIVLDDQKLIDQLNKFENKTYAVNSSAVLVSNYDEAITNNFTEKFIKDNISHPNGFIGMVDNDYYVVNEKIDNYFFKEADIKLMSIKKDELYFKVINTYYDAKCASGDSGLPSITCSDITKSKSLDFRLVKENDNFKISEMTLVLG